MRVIFLTICLLLSSQYAAAGTQTGKVANLATRAGDGLIVFELEGSHDQRPACAAIHSYWIINDENSATGKRQFAMLMAAQATGRTVSINGSNTCTRWADGEDVNGLTII